MRAVSSLSDRRLQLPKSDRAQKKIVSLKKSAAAAPYYTGDMEDGRDKDGPSEV